VLIGIEDCVGGCDLDQLRGAIRRTPVLGTCFIAFLFSLVGLPPFAGFTAKYLVMLHLADAKCWWLILAIGINSVISLFYYMRLAKAVALDAPGETESPQLPAPAPIYGVLAGVHFALLLALFAWFDAPLRVAQQVVEKLH
jgi:NADH-quinone oxidoreductase subunit N